MTGALNSFAWMKTKFHNFFIAYLTTILDRFLEKKKSRFVNFLHLFWFLLRFVKFDKKAKIWQWCRKKKSLILIQSWFRNEWVKQQPLQQHVVCVQLKINQISQNEATYVPSYQSMFGSDCTLNTGINIYA